MISIQKKTLFEKLHEAIGFTPKVATYHDASNTSKIDLYVGVDRPDFGITTYSTIGLSESSIDLVDKNNKDIRVEFIGICNSDVLEFPNIISSCAFNIINSNYSCDPGTVYPNVVKAYYPNIDLKHILFTPPYLWETLGNLELEKFHINWLMTIPISDNELQYLETNGSDALEEALEKNDVCVFDIYRKSIL
ncbi:MAG: suppressor of fused domain protein [Oscillospiraceae bacterium]|nr:suppressor of fused domain protein [Oscillospiraceae bacterium]